MKLNEVLVFKNPKTIDWEATEQEIMNHVICDHPDARASEIVMTAANLCTQARKAVKKLGVARLYQDKGA